MATEVVIHDLLAIGGGDFSSSSSIINHQSSISTDQMIQLFFALAFSAVPLTLYVPPIRSLNLFVESVEQLFRQTTSYSLHAFPRLRFIVSRFFSSLLRT
ncbi:hypothetical protein LOK49_LG10G02936 [Camellia lanceoleosa]|uniref:Uncharacterized protein n=1 Tax=Camellia lanceoleosa TaxID=1840588 RepID=A0ACC0G6H2_9ERIC|nr:hypothetical protein LOK49_LG10G02936 [Camellia lanceoleosa]